VFTSGTLSEAAMTEDTGNRRRAVIADHNLELAENIAVLSDRGLYRDGIIEILRRRGFRRVDGFASLAALLKAARGTVIDLTLVDLSHEREDPEEILGRLRSVHPDVTVVAIGTSLQLAARAPDIDGCIELPSDGASRLAAMARAVARRRGGPVKFPVSPEVERQSRTWASVTRRQRQVLGLLGCGMDKSQDRQVPRHLGARRQGTRQRVAREVRYG
jgi:DNA-binding NarL/FixJ family response regulator